MIGIQGVGAYFPSEIRTNDWWPAELLDTWRKAAANRPPLQISPDASPGTRLVLEALARQAADPFQGVTERRVMAETDTLLDLQERAARIAIERAGIDPGAIDLVIGFGLVPEVMLSNPAAGLHHRLGLSPACLSIQVEAAAYSFLAQLSIAESMIAAGRARLALLVHGCAATRHVPREDTGSVVLGDGAAAVVVGPVSGDRGIHETVHFTDGRFPRALVMTVPGGNWFDAGRPYVHVAEPNQMREVFLGTADVCKQSIEAVLAKANRDISEIDFACVFQGTSWLRAVVHDYLGLASTRSLEMFETYGYMSSVMIPANLFLAETQGVLREGDLVVLTGGGIGITYGATLLRWGR